MLPQAFDHLMFVPFTDTNSANLGSSVCLDSRFIRLRSSRFIRLGSWFPPCTWVILIGLPLQYGGSLFQNFNEVRHDSTRQYNN